QRRSGERQGEREHGERRQGAPCGMHWNFPRAARSAARDAGLWVQITGASTQVRTAEGILRFFTQFILLLQRGELTLLRELAGSALQVVEDQLQRPQENRRRRLLDAGEPGNDIRGRHAQVVAELAGTAEFARGYLQGLRLDRERHGKNLIRSPERAQVAAARFRCSGLTHRFAAENSGALRRNGREKDCSLQTTCLRGICLFRRKP